ncbi:MAG: serine/threonine protein kinase [Candidatus Melainabacteria bacterium]|nr:MAG: serine/threonine protein kinase [Candidatus Melainabacteria bacterium]
MIESKERDSGGFNQNAENVTANPEAIEQGAAGKGDPLLNKLFAEKYVIEQRLGAGGMSVVYLARHEALNKKFAIKTLHTHLTAKATSLLRFKQEAQAASRLQHPGIVAMHDYGVTENGIPYLVMDYVPGESLADLLNKTKSLDRELALDIFKQTAAAIAHAHHRGIVHRDLKPSNIMLNYDDDNALCVKIVDFGVAKFVEDEDNAKLTQTGEALGSPLYMSPEQCQGQPLDIRSDIYSFGCVMYEAITGVPPLDADSVFKIMMKHIHDVPPSFKEARPDLSDCGDMERIVFKAFTKDPAKRYQKMDDLLADLNSLNEQKGFAERIKQKFELTGLRQTTKSINFLVTISVLIGGAILFAATYALNSMQALSVQPDLWSEGAIWQPYKDKPAITEADEEKHALLSDGQGLFLEGAELGVNQAIDKHTKGKSDGNRKEVVKRYSDLASSKITKAHSERRHHEYELAASSYADAISDVKKYIDSTDLERANALDKLTVAYMGKGDCEYFQSPANLSAAAHSYANAVQTLRQTKNNFAWTQLQGSAQLYLLLRYADALGMLGRYQEAASVRLIIPKLLRSEERELKDGTYVALTQSKIAEEEFRLKKLNDARESYKTALDEWQKDGSNCIEEQAKVMARIAEIDAIQNNTEHDTRFLDFEALAEKIRKEDPKLLRNQFFSDAYQAYAHYLWQHNDVLKAIQMHQRSIECQS